MTFVWNVVVGAALAFGATANSHAQDPQRTGAVFVPPSRAACIGAQLRTDPGRQRLGARVESLRQEIRRDRFGRNEDVAKRTSLHRASWAVRSLDDALSGYLGSPGGVRVTRTSSKLYYSALGRPWQIHEDVVGQYFRVFDLRTNQYVDASGKGISEYRMGQPREHFEAASHFDFSALGEALPIETVPERERAAAARREKRLHGTPIMEMLAQSENELARRQKLEGLDLAILLPKEIEFVRRWAAPIIGAKTPTEQRSQALWWVRELAQRDKVDGTWGPLLRSVADLGERPGATPSERLAASESAAALGRQRMKAVLDGRRWKNLTPPEREAVMSALLEVASWQRHPLSPEFGERLLKVAEQAQDPRLLVALLALRDGPMGRWKPEEREAIRLRFEQALIVLGRMRR